MFMPNGDGVSRTVEQAPGENEQERLNPDLETSLPQTAIEAKLLYESLENFRRIPTLCLGSICDGLLLWGFYGIC